MLSYGQPDYRYGVLVVVVVVVTGVFHRLNYFTREKYNWTVLPVQPISKPCVGAVADPDPANVHYVYIMQKNT